MSAGETMSRSDEVLTLMRERLVDAEGGVERLRAAIAVMESDRTGSDRSGSDRTNGSRTRPSSASPTALADGARASDADADADATGRPEQARPPRRRREVAAEPATVVPLERLLAVVAEHPDQPTSWLATHTGGDSRQLLALLKEAEAGGEVRRRGQRRSTRWSRITDEDRIAERVRELEAAGRSRTAEPS